MYSFAYTILDGVNGNILTKNILVGNDVSKIVVPTLRNEYRKFDMEFRKREHKISMTLDNWEVHMLTIYCIHCTVKLSDYGGSKAVRHHDHLIPPVYKDGELFSGNYIATICHSCNTQITNKRRIMNVYMHNGGKYDTHLFLGDVRPEEKENVFILPKQGNGIYMFKVGNINFIDSLNFLPESLGKLAESLAVGVDIRSEAFPITYKTLQSMGYNQDVIEKSLCKGAFPYEHVDDISKLDQPLPPRKKFDSVLTGELSQKTYDDVVSVYEAGGFTTLRELHDLYITQDICLLADCFQFYRKFGIENWGLDPANYCTQASFFMDCALKYSNTSLDLISCPELYEALENSKIGGFVTVNQRRVSPNNVHLDDYDPCPNTPDTYAALLDLNGMYSGLMEEKLPVGDMELLKDTEYIKFLETFDNGNGKIDYSGDTGYFVEVDYEIPDTDKVRTDELPLSLYVAENITGSPHTRGLTNVSEESNGRKLVATHLPVQKMVFHMKLLELFVELGFQVQKVHRVWAFKQKAFLKDFVVQNRLQRISEKNVFFQKILKLASNAPFGKFLFNDRIRNTNTILCYKKKLLSQHARSANFKRCIMINEDVAMIEKYRKEILLKTPIYVGVTILQLAKAQYWSVFYKELKQEFGDKVRLIYGDTDSYLLLFTVDKGTTFQELLNNKCLKNLIDCSNMSGKFVSRNDNFKGQKGKLKSETGDDIITDAICLKPKLYSLQTMATRKMAMKGISARQQQTVSHQNFIDIIEDPSHIQIRPEATIRLMDRRICTVVQEKNTMSLVDKKRWWKTKKMSVAYGHPDIQGQEGANHCIPIRFVLGDCFDQIEYEDNEVSANTDFDECLDEVCMHVQEEGSGILSSHKSVEHGDYANHMHEQGAHDMETGVKRSLDEHTEFIEYKRRK